MKLTFIFFLVLVAPKAVCAQVQVSPTSNGCLHIEEVAKLAQELQFPDGWRIQVVCDENTWHMAQRRFDAFATDTGFTNLSNRFTLIRDSTFQPRVLKHERGHIACNCKDEKKAEEWAKLH